MPSQSQSKKSLHLTLQPGWHAICVENQPRRNEEHEEGPGKAFVLFVFSWLIFGGVVNEHTMAGFALRREDDDQSAGLHPHRRSFNRVRHCGELGGLHVRQWYSAQANACAS